MLATLFLRLVQHNFLRQHDDDLHGLEGVADRFRRPEERRATLMVTPTTVQLLQRGLDLKHDFGTNLV